MSRLYATYKMHYERMLNSRPSVQLKNFDYTAYQRTRPWISEIRKSAKILDIGCGYGHQLYILHNLGFVNLHGIEITETSLQIGQEEVGHFAKLQLADAFEYLENHINEYSAILLMDVLEHIPRENIIKLLSLIHRALIDGGTLAVRVPNMSSLLAMYSMCLDFTHLVGFTEYSLMQILDTAGFIDHRIVRGSARIQIRNWRPWRPLRGIGLTVQANLILHKILYRLRGQTPLPSVYDYNLEVWTNKYANVES